MKKNIEIISLIFKSTLYLQHIASELLSDVNKVEGWEVGLKIIANDPTQNVINFIKSGVIDRRVKIDIYNDKNPYEYYLNRVYRCYNYGGKISEYDNICFVNSDFVFSKNWLFNLLKYHDGINIPCSRLIESGKMLSGKHGMGFNLGKTLLEFNRELWKHFSEKVLLEENVYKSGGLYMPCVFEKERFIESGMYPEGNIYDNGIGTLGNLIKASDDYYFHDILEKKYGMKHITAFDSLVYHLQEGEKDE